MCLALLMSKIKKFLVRGASRHYIKQKIFVLVENLLDLVYFFFWLSQNVYLFTNTSDIHFLWLHTNDLLQTIFDRKKHTKS